MLGVAEGGLSTPEVYAELDRMRADMDVPAPSVPQDLLGALRRADAAAVSGSLGNDLQAAAIRRRPELSQVLTTGAERGALGGIVSGSGPTVVFLAPNAQAAAALADALVEGGTCAAAVATTGAAGGARVTAR